MNKPFRERLRVPVLIAGIALGASSIAPAAHAWGDGDSIRGNEKFVDVERPAGAFHAVSVSAGIRVELKAGAPAISVHAEENIAPLVITEIDGGELHVRWKNHSSHSDNGVTVKVSAPGIDQVEVSGGSEAHGEVAKGDSLSVDASGGGELHLKNVDAKRVEANGSGGAVLELAGSCDELAVEASGGVRVQLGKLSAKTVKLEASGGVSGELRATESVRGEASGGVSLRIAGGAKTHVRTSGGADIDVD